MTAAELTLVIVGIPSGLELGRRTVWRWLRGGVKIGDALPLLPTLPQELKALKDEVAASRGETALARQELRDHVALEVEGNKLLEQAVLSLVGRQERIEGTLQRMGSQIHTVQQTVMNLVEPGAGDRWRLTQSAQQPSVSAPERPIAWNVDPLLAG